MRSLFIALLAALALYMGINTSQAAPPLPATFLANSCGYLTGVWTQPCIEPIDPGSVGWAYGCGFIVGTPVIIVDETTLQDMLWPLTLRDKVGLHLSIMDIEMPDAAGCITLRYQAWGQGLHTYSLYQQLQGRNPKLVAKDMRDVFHHHPNTENCMTYRPPNTAGSPFWPDPATANFESNNCLPGG